MDMMVKKAALSKSLQFMSGFNLDYVLNIQQFYGTVY